MRENKFRGKRVDNGEWVYGWYVYDENNEIHTIHNSEFNIVGLSSRGTEVIPSTVDQYTGLQDKNRKDIYEGDKIKDNVGRMWSISYRDNLATFIFNWNGRKDSWQNYMQFISEQKPFEIIGNIHDK